MKNRTYSECILLAVLVLLAMLVPLTAQADSALKWEEVDKPGISGNVIVSPSEVSETAVGSSGVLYAIDSADSKIYRSLDGGVTFEDITDKLEGEGAGLPASKIAVAPDEPGIVAMVTDGGSAVYLSTDDGINWADTGVPTLEGKIQAISVSEEYTQDGEAIREIAIGTAIWGDDATSGQVWVYQTGKSISLWLNQELTVDTDSPTPTNGEVSALAYSPRYSDDTALVVVASTNGDVTGYEDRTWLCIGLRDTTEGTTEWNDLADLTPVVYPVEIAPAGDAPDVSWFSSSLALPSNYTVAAASKRQLFISYNREPNADDDVYWLDDNIVVRLDVDNGSPIDISSIAYHGTTSSGTLLAGDVDPSDTSTVPVWRTDEPFSAPPDWEEATVPPTGPGNARLAWSHDGDLAYCGTGQLPGVALDESALSASADDGDKWRQLGLIDTEIRLADVAVSPDGESLFVTTSSPYGPEGVWRSTSDPLGRYWERLLTFDTTTDTVILRLSPNYSLDDTIYAAEVGGDLMAVSYDGGSSWSWRHAPGSVIDLVVENGNTAYIALPDGVVKKSTQGGHIWKSQGDTLISEINMLDLAGDGTLFIGSRDGRVAYSSDGGNSFSRISEVIGSGTGNVQVVADAHFDDNGIIYAATDVADEGIWRWTIGVSDDWERIDESVTGLGQRIAGLAMGDEGTLYALRLEPDGGVIRSLNPTEADPEDVEFELVNRALPAGTAFDPTPLFPTLPYLKLSGDSTQNQLWTIDTANELIYKFRDTLCKLGPTPVSPGMSEIIIIDNTGQIEHLTLQWQEIAGAREYQAAIYADAGATQELWSGTTPYTVIVATEGNNPVSLLSGTTYYWRVRATQPIESPWSALKPFASPLGVEEWSPLAEPTRVSPPAGASGVPVMPAFSWTSAIGATGYEFVLAKDSGFTEVVVAFSGADALPSTAWNCDIELDYATSYFWRVRAVSEDSHSQWGVSTFTTEAAPPETTPPTSPPIVVESPPAAPSYIIWLAIGIGAVLFAALVVFIIRTRIKL
jgi:photosystem II stability/assembly factor-like uncharacterized protein